MMDDYEMLCEYGQTSDGTIYLMQHKTKGFLAIKKSLPAYCYGVYSRLLQINHKAILKVYEVQVIEEKCIVMEEFINGSPLVDRIAINNLFTIEETRQIASELCEAVSILAASNIVHRDINANNVMLTCDHKVKLFDFNISRIYNKNVSHDTHYLGTDGYAPPEQFGFAQTDVRSDIYSIGVLMNEMLTGHTLQEGIYPTPGQMKHIISKATQLDMNNRYEKVEYMLEDLNSSHIARRTGVDKIFRKIPGFRTLVLWKMCFAVIGYLLTLIMLIWLVGDAIDNPSIIPSEIIFFILIYVLPYCLFLNPADIRSKLFGIEKNQRWFAFCLATGFISLGLLWGAFL